MGDGDPADVTAPDAVEHARLTTLIVRTAEEPRDDSGGSGVTSASEATAAVGLDS